MNILKELEELKKLFIIFEHDIKEDYFIFIRTSKIDLSWKFPKYKFNLTNDINIKLLEKKLIRINSIFHSKEAYLDNIFHKKLNSFFLYMENIINCKSFFENKTDFINYWLFKINELTDLTSNIFDIYFQEKNKYHQVKIETLNNNWNLAFENYWVQSIQNINNEVDKIIELLENKNFSNKDELKSLLEDFKQTQDKTKLEKVLTNMASISWIWSLITSIIALL